jgi:hypothetical protein
LLASSGTCGCFLCRRRCAHGIEPASDEIPGVTTEIRAAKKYRQPVDRNQPNRERLGANAWFAFLALNSSVHFLDIGLFTIIHSLADSRWRFGFVAHCVFILPAREIRRLPERVMPPVIPRLALRLRQI